jgi:hypothetical protein
MRKEKKSTRRPGRYDSCFPEEGMIGAQEPDLDFSYAPPSSIEQDCITIESLWKDNFVVASETDVSSSSERTNTTTTLPYLEALCASHDCPVKQEMESLCYLTIAIDRPMKRRATKVKRTKEMTTRAEPAQDTNHFRRAKKQNLVDSTIKPKQPQQKKFTTKETNNNGEIPILTTVFQREVETRAPRGCVGVSSNTKPSENEANATKLPTKNQKRNKDTREGMNTAIPSALVSDISVQRENERRPILGFTTAPPSTGMSFSSKQVASVVKATQRDDQLSSPTSANDIMKELLKLQETLDSLRLTQHNIMPTDVLSDAAKRAYTDSELLEFPLDETEELVNGLSSQAFESNQDAPHKAKVNGFSRLVDILAQREAPASEIAFIDEGVRIRQFGSKGDGPGTPGYSFSIMIDNNDDDEEEYSSPTLPKPLPKDSRRKSRMSRMKKSKLDSTETSTLQKQMLKFSILSLSRDISVDATSQTVKVDKVTPVTSPTDGPEAPQTLNSDSWSQTQPNTMTTRDALLDATKHADTNSELLAFPFDENEELMDDLSSQSFESKRDTPDVAKATVKVDKFMPLAWPREGPEAAPLVESNSWSPTLPYSKSRRESPSSPSTISVSDEPRESFSIRGALNSIRRPRARTSSTRASPLVLESIRPENKRRFHNRGTSGLDIGFLPVDLGVWG